MRKRSVPLPASPGILPVVILAAGRGERLRGETEGCLKPLTPVLGLTLLERAILSCREVGVTECIVVVGYGEEQMLAHVDELARRHTMRVCGVANPHWEEGNGTSVSAALPHLNGRFLLIRCDHVFDLNDATKVRLDGQTITAIGKYLPSYTAIDTGLFLCRPLLFEALACARTEGDASLTGGMQRLIRKAQVRAVDIGDHFWSDIDTPQSLSYTERELLARLAKPHGDGIVARYLNRPVSRRISQYLSRTSLTPNTISVVSFLMCLAGACLFTRQGYIWGLLAGVVIHLASIIDGCDGEIARLKYRTSRFGAWFDTVLDRYADVAIAVGITYGYARTHASVLVWLGGIVALSGMILFSYSRKEYHLRYGHDLPATLRYTILLASRDVRLFVVFLGALLHRPFAALLMTGLLAHLVVGWQFVTVYRHDRHSGP